MKFEIKNRWTGKVQFSANIDCADGTHASFKLGLAVKAAVDTRANLTGANLSGADLSGANLYRANLTGADLYGANLSGADLSGANLYRADLTRANLTGANLYRANLSGADLTRADLTGANLYRANLTGADLTGANLYRANLTGANLTGADLYGANLSGANLTGANLTGANLTGANLYRANLSGADLTRADNIELQIAKTRILPEGSIIGWKRCANGVIVKLRIPEEAKRSHAFGRKCRAEYADVIEVYGSDVGVSNHDGKTEYRTGMRVTPDKFDENWMDECSNGIHFFITREEAEAY